MHDMEEESLKTLNCFKFMFWILCESNKMYFFLKPTFIATNNSHPIGLHLLPNGLMPSDPATKVVHDTFPMRAPWPAYIYSFNSTIK